MSLSFGIVSAKLITQAGTIPKVTNKPVSYQTKIKKNLRKLRKNYPRCSTSNVESLKIIAFLPAIIKFAQTAQKLFPCFQW